jgi:hypothetical protein
LLLGFAVLVVYMLGQADGNATIWDRQIYIFGAVEAIVFTAVGWIFGREVHRSSAESAREDAEAAKAEVGAKTEQVTQLTKESAKGRVLALAVDAMPTEPAPAPPPGGLDVGAIPPPAPAPAAAALTSVALIKDLAAKLYDE